MQRLLLLAALPLLVAAADEVPFEPSARTFADAAACRTHLVDFVKTARAENPVAAEGPYQIAPGDVRAHKVLVSGNGHSITEHRCLGDKLSSRTWRHSMEGAASDEPETIDSMAAKAEWLKKKPQ